ncbi:MAG: hypothetical protein D6751_03425 [Deltaproteobacteria bacterium]|nr:MAG: hypothetical protein D6751_03425 [Deltaproteobacteria bacterium]
MIQELQLCAQIEEVVRDIYTFLAEGAETQDLARFWRDLADDESEHINLIRFASRLDDVAFDGFARSAGELRALLFKARDVSDLVQGRIWQLPDLVDLLASLEREFMVLHAALMARFVDDAMRRLFEQLGQGDEKHLARLESLAGELRAGNDDT